jgi:hypothetical protein
VTQTTINAVNTDAATADVTRTPFLVSKYTGTGANLGQVLVRIYGTGLTTSTPFRVDQLLVGRTIKTGGITNGSTVTLAAATTNKDFQGSNWILALVGGVNISGSAFIGAVSVTGTASGTTAVTFKECDFGAATCPPGQYRECGFGIAAGTFTAASTGLYNIDWPKSRVAGGGTPVYNWATATGTVDVNFRGNLGGGYHYIDGDTTISVETLAGGTQTFNGGGTIRFRGMADTITILNHADGKTSKITGVVGDVNINGTGGTVIVKGYTGTITDNSGGAVEIDSSEAGTTPKPVPSRPQFFTSMSRAPATSAL